MSTQPIRKAEHAELHAAMTEMREALDVWGERLAATRGDDARFLLRKIDRAISAVREAAIAVEVIYPETKQEPVQEAPKAPQKPAEPLSARRISNLLKKAGVNVGYRYTQYGYTRHDGSRPTEPGVMITRQRDGRYGGKEDVGGVEIYLIQNPIYSHVEPTPEFLKQVTDALTEAGLRHTYASALGLVAIPDDQEV